MRRRFDYEKLRYDCCPLSARVGYSPKSAQPNWNLFLSIISFVFFFQFSFLASLVAVFGEFDISGDLEKKRSVTKNIKRIVVHREYDAATFENDLALLEMESPIHYDTHIGM